jgi:type IV pilus assembly protein PilW
MKKWLSGNTLIELMLSIMLSMLVVGLVITVYLATEKIHLTQTALMTIQENSRAAIHILNSDIRMAGYIGCVKLKNGFFIDNNTPFVLTDKNKIQNYSGPEIKAGSNAITLRHMAASHATLLQTMQDYSVLYVTAVPHFSNGDILLIADCKRAEIFLVKKVVILGNHTQKIISARPLSTLFKEYSEVGRFEVNTYFIGKTPYQTTKGLPIYALYRKDIHSYKTELVQGVNDMKIHYGIIDNGRLVEHPANEISDSPIVLSVSIKLTFNSIDALKLSKNEYSYVTLRE